MPVSGVHWVFKLDQGMDVSGNKPFSFELLTPTDGHLLVINASEWGNTFHLVIAVPVTGISRIFGAITVVTSGRDRSLESWEFHSVNQPLKGRKVSGNS